MTIASLAVLTMRSRTASCLSSYVGLRINLSSFLITLKHAIGPSKGIGERCKAQDAPITESTSGSYFSSADKVNAVIITSLKKPSGNKGLIERSITRETKISLSVGLPSLLKNPPGILPQAEACSR